MELFNPGNFTVCAQELHPGLIIDMSVDPEKDMRVDTYRVQARHDIGTEDPLIVIATPPCMHGLFLAEHPGVSIVTGDMCRWGMHLSLSGSRWLRWVGLVLGKGCSLTPPYFASASPGPKSRDVARGEGCRTTRGSTGLGATAVRPRL